MKNKTSLESKSNKVIRRFARYLGLFLILLTLAFAIPELITEQNPNAEPTRIDIILTGALMLVGLALAWKWELIGGIVFSVIGLVMTPIVYSHNFAMNQNVGMSLIIIASITGVGGFAVLNPSGNSDVSTETKNKIMIVQYFFAFLNVLGGILTSISKFSQSLSLSEAHSAMCVQWSKFYRTIDMELSLDVKHRGDVVEFIMKCKKEYDRLLDESPVTLGSI